MEKGEGSFHSFEMLALSNVFLRGNNTSTILICLLMLLLPLVPSPLSALDDPFSTLAAAKYYYNHNMLNTTTTTTTTTNNKNNSNNSSPPSVTWVAGPLFSTLAAAARTHRCQPAARGFLAPRRPFQHSVVWYNIVYYACFQ